MRLSSFSTTYIAFSIRRRVRVFSVAANLQLVLLGASHAFPLDPNAHIDGTFDQGNVHSVPPNLIASELAGDNRTRLGALVTNGSSLEVGSTGSISASQWSIGDAIGVVVSQSAALNVAQGGRITTWEDGIGDSIGLVTELNGESSFNGILDSREFGNGRAIVAHVSDTAKLAFAGSAGAMDEGNGDAIGFQATGSSNIVFTGTVTLSEEGNGDAIPFHMTGQSRLQYDGVMNVIEEGNAARAGGFIGGGAAVLLEGGALSIDSDGLSGGARLVMLELADQALLSITGGRYEVLEDGVNITPLITVSGDAELRIKGFELNRPYGVVLDDAGMVSGRLADGQAFHFEFMRMSGTASIVLVPEPGGLVMAAAVTGLVAGIRRRLMRT